MLRGAGRFRYALCQSEGVALMRFGHRCPSCGSYRVKRSGARSRLHALYEWALIRTYRCTQCNWPFLSFGLNLRLVPNGVTLPPKDQAFDE